jgi:hypothetical protein
MSMPQMPTYNGANNSDDPLVTPWNIRGWTAQAIPQDTVAVTTAASPSAPLPSNLVYAVVQAPYYDFDNNPLSGFLMFCMSEAITVTSNGKTYRIPARYAGRDVSQFAGAQNAWGSGKIYIRHGLMSVLLMTTDNPAIVTDSGSPLTYHVTEHFLGGQQFDITLPTSSVSPVDLRSLVVSGSIQTYNFDPTNIAGMEVPG